jgi:hypothetical protein
VHVDADVARLAQERGTGVDAHPRSNRAGRERVSRVGRRRERSRCRREGDKECVALRVDLDAAVSVERLAQNASMLRECVRIALGTEFAQQLGRPLDVGKEERDSAGRKLERHGLHDAECGAVLKSGSDGARAGL